MIAATIAIRTERAADASALYALHRAAFKGVVEANLVDALREEGAVVLSLVAEEVGKVFGHVLYSRVVIDGRARAVALAPISVDPARQRRGIGSRLIEEAHRELKSRGETLAFVLGEPGYYGRFGFSREAASAFQTPYDGPYMMALALAASAPRSGKVRYAAPFERLS